MQKFNELPKYTFHEAQKIAQDRHEIYQKAFEDAGKPGYRDYEDFLNSLPDDVCNVNLVQRHPFYIIAKGTERYYEYPAGLMCWGGEIPEEAFIDESILSEPVWAVVSYKRDFSEF